MNIFNDEYIKFEKKADLLLKDVYDSKIYGLKTKNKKKNNINITMFYEIIFFDILTYKKNYGNILDINYTENLLHLKNKMILHFKIKNNNPDFFDIILTDVTHNNVVFNKRVNSHDKYILEELHILSNVILQNNEKNVII